MRVSLLARSRALFSGGWGDTDDAAGGKDGTGGIDLGTLEFEVLADETSTVSIMMLCSESFE